MGDHSIIFGLFAMGLVWFTVWTVLSVFTHYTPKEVAKKMVWFATPFVAAGVVGFVVMWMFGMVAIGDRSPNPSPAPELSDLDKWAYAHPLAYMNVVSNMWYATFACLAWCAIFGISETRPSKRHWWFAVGFIVFIAVFDAMTCIQFSHGLFNEVTNSYEWR